MSNKSLDVNDLLEGLYNLLKTNGEYNLNEKAVGKAQQRFFGMVHSAQKGKNAASPKVSKVAHSMKKKDATDFAKTTHKGLPDKIKKECAGVGIITKQNSTKDVNKSTPQKNLDAFHLEEALLDMYQSLTEGGTEKLSQTAQDSIRGAITTPAANNNGGDAYKSYRFGLALAGAPDYPTKAVNDIGGDPLLTTYTDEEWNMVQYAGKQADVGPLKRLSSNRSVENKHTNTTSPVAKIKKNKYGV